MPTTIKAQPHLRRWRQAAHGPHDHDRVATSNRGWGATIPGRQRLTN